MFKFLYPDMFVNSIYDINAEQLKKKGIKALLFDIDNTLVPMYQKDADEKVVQYIKTIQEKNFKVGIVSNAAQKRVDRFNKDINIHTVYRAGKPGIKAMVQAGRHLGYEPEEVALIGDQIFTDIAGGNKAGMTTILVKPIHKSESPHIRLKRVLEWFILQSYKKKMQNK